jgi:hypothetical protein
VLRVLVEILGSNSIAVRRSFACQGKVALEYLMGAAADFDVGPVAVECLIVLRDSRLLFKRAICVKATAWPLIWSRSHVIRNVGSDLAALASSGSRRDCLLFWLAVAITFDGMNPVDSRSGQWRGSRKSTEYVPRAGASCLCGRL